MKFQIFEKMRASYRTRTSATKRAAELGCRIKAAIDEGKFKLGSGYLRHAWKLVDGRVQMSSYACAGCAVAAAAFACGLTEGDQEDCQIQVAKDTGLMSRQEAAQLEMGFENWRSCDTWTGKDERRSTRSPFYKLGKKMGIAAKHRSEQDVDAYSSEDDY